jgi:hypothetical protein
LQGAEINWIDGAAIQNHQVFIAKASAPASTVDGSVLLAAGTRSISTGPTYSGGWATLTKDHYIAAGLGLYFMPSGTLGASASNNRSARYKLL